MSWACTFLTEKVCNIYISLVYDFFLKCDVIPIGRFTYDNSSVLSNIKRNKQLCMQYVDAKCEPTMEYPLNPNGSKEAVAGLSSENGRHLAVMPHPERCFLSWQWPYKPSPIGDQEFSPWMAMFINAYKFCESFQ